MKPEDIEVGGVYSNGRQERQVLELHTRSARPWVLYRVVAKRGGGPLRVGDVLHMTLAGFSGWATRRIDNLPEVNSL